MKKLFAILLFSYISNAAALDMQDAGQYTFIHKDGHVTNSVSRLSFANGRWKLEDRKEDGTWDDVTCEKNCLLVDSTQKDVEYFMGGKPPPGLAAECIHNQAFAFCRVTKQGSDIRKYLFIALTQQRPIPINLKKIK